MVRFFVKKITWLYFTCKQKRDRSFVYIFFLNIQILLNHFKYKKNIYFIYKDLLKFPSQMVYKNYLKTTKSVLGSMEISLVQISFDGNCSWNPPYLMDRNMFEKLQNASGMNFNSYINIIYTDAFHFMDCDINQLAANSLQMTWFNKRIRPSY